MRYSNYVGVLAAVLLAAACFMEWVYVGSIRVTITGLQTSPTTLGKPGLVHLFFAAISTAFFLLPYTWAKRANLFVAAFNLAWACRNYLIITQCQMGECPEKKAGMYLVMVSSAVLFVMSLLPKLTVSNTATSNA